MDQVERALHSFLALLSAMLEPVTWSLERARYSIIQQFDRIGVPYRWQDVIITVAWVLIVLMTLRTLTGWLRLVAIVLVALVLGRVYGVLPRA